MVEPENQQEVIYGKAAEKWKTIKFPNNYISPQFYQISL